MFRNMPGVRDSRVALTAVALLAVTIGAVTAVFAIAHAIVLRPFPFADQSRVAVIWQRQPNLLPLQVQEVIEDLRLNFR